MKFVSLCNYWSYYYLIVTIYPKCSYFLYFSITNKFRMKFVSFLHILLLSGMVVRLATSIFRALSMVPPKVLVDLRFPAPLGWEYAYLASLFPTILSLLSLNKNKVLLMRMYFVGTVIFGLGTVFYGCVDLWDDLIEYLETKKARIHFQGYPAVVIWYMFLCVALQIHAFGLYFSLQLLKAWTVKVGRKKKAQWERESRCWKGFLCPDMCRKDSLDDEGTATTQERVCKCENGSEPYSTPPHRRAAVCLSFPFSCSSLPTAFLGELSHLCPQSWSSQAWITSNAS